MKKYSVLLSLIVGTSCGATLADDRYPAPLYHTGPPPTPTAYHEADANHDNTPASDALKLVINHTLKTNGNSQRQNGGYRHSSGRGKDLPRYRLRTSSDKIMLKMKLTF